MIKNEKHRFHKHKVGVFLLRQNNPIRQIKEVRYLLLIIYPLNDNPSSSNKVLIVGKEAGPIP